MHTETTGTALGSSEHPSPRARTLRFQALANRVMRGLLRTPLLCRLVGRRLITLYVTGRKSGRTYPIPVAYTRQDAALLIGSPFGWIRNLRTGEPLEIRLKGARRLADVEAFTAESDVVDAYASMARGNRAFAGFNSIRLDAEGEPDPGDLHLAWAAGARAARLTVRP
jgi:hypothetical protein